MGRPLHFEFLRDTPNYRLFTAQSEELGKDVNLWLPHHALTNIDKFSGYVSNGNVRDMGVFPDAFRIHTDLPDPPKEVLYRKVIGPDNRVRFYPIAPEPSPRVQFKVHGTETGRFYSYEKCPKPFGMSAMEMGVRIHEAAVEALKPATRADMRALAGRVTKLEQRQGILFQAVEKLIKIIGWVRGK